SGPHHGGDLPRAPRGDRARWLPRADDEDFAHAATQVLARLEDLGPCLGRKTRPSFPRNLGRETTPSFRRRLRRETTPSFRRRLRRETTPSFWRRLRRETTPSFPRRREPMFPANPG